MAEYAPDAIRACYETIRAGVPSAVMSGIVGDQAHTYGYHRGRNYVPGTDYSVQRPDDQQGHGEAACGLDVSFGPDDMRRVTQRLIDASLSSDGRVWALREFYGTVDGVNVTGLDVREKRWVTSDPTHLWHVHFSFYRKFGDDHAALQQVASVVTGGGTHNPDTRRLVRHGDRGRPSEDHSGGTRKADDAAGLRRRQGRRAGSQHPPRQPRVYPHRRPQRAKDGRARHLRRRKGRATGEGHPPRQPQAHSTRSGVTGMSEHDERPAEKPEPEFRDVGDADEQQLDVTRTDQERETRQGKDDQSEDE